jgi:hypothetical protein
MRATQRMPLGRPLHLTVPTINFVEALKGIPHLRLLPAPALTMNSSVAHNLEEYPHLRLFPTPAPALTMNYVTHNK